MTKGHVPPENLAEYRRLRTLRWQAADIKSALADRGQPELALTLFPVMHELRRMMNALRVDLPDAPNQENAP